MRFGDYVNVDGESEQHSFVVSNHMPRAVLCIRNADLDVSGQLHTNYFIIERMRFCDYVNADGEIEQFVFCIGGDMPGADLRLRNADADRSRELHAHHSCGERL